MFPAPQPVVPSLQARVHPDEWQARLELAACSVSLPCWAGPR